jgi:hypothetical protein
MSLAIVSGFSVNFYLFFHHQELKGRGGKGYELVPAYRKAEAEAHLRILL